MAALTDLTSHTTVSSRPHSPVQAQTSLRMALLEALDEPARERFEELVDLESLLQAHLRRGQERYPGLRVSGIELARGMARWLESKEQAREALETVDAAEAYLLCGCLAGESLAWAYFDADYFDRARHALRGMTRSNADVEEILQRVRQRLLQPDDDGETRLARYLGKGDLRTLVRIAATRLAIDQIRKQRRELGDSEEELLSLPARVEDPEMAVLRRECCGEFEPAFAQAVRVLAPRQRNLLRLHIVDGVPLHALAKTYGVHKTTVVRWLVRARQDLLNALMDELGQRLSMHDEDVRSLVELIRSRVDLSLHRLLQTMPAA